MNPLSGLSWLRALKRRHMAARPKEPDLGDMGTTFGLEAAIPSLNDGSRRALKSRDPGETQQMEDHRPTRPMRY